MNINPQCKWHFYAFADYRIKVIAASPEFCATARLCCFVEGTLRTAHCSEQNSWPDHTFMSFHMYNCLHKHAQADEAAGLRGSRQTEISIPNDTTGWTIVPLIEIFGEKKLGV